MSAKTCRPEAGGRWATRSSEAIATSRNPAARARNALRASFLSIAGLIASPAPGLRCLFCHGIFDDEVENFRNICRSLSRAGTLIDSATCLDMLHGRIEISGKYYHLSFDDGFRNILYNGLPILQEFSIPATIFVVTELAGASYETVARYCATRWSSYAAPIETLSWADIAELQRCGMDIGSHTQTHADLSMLRSRGELFAEISVSKQQIEQRLGTACRYIAWPYGALGSISEESIAFVREAGFAGCFGGFRGAVRPGMTDPFRIPRHQFEPSWPISHIRFFVSGHAD